MRRHNDFDRLMGMILYVFPKYLVKINNQRDRIEDFTDNYLLEEFIEKLDFKDLREYYEKKVDEKTKFQNEAEKGKVIEKEGNLKKNTSAKNLSHKEKDKLQSKDEDNFRFRGKEQDKYHKKEAVTSFEYELKIILNNLLNKKISICIEDSMEGIINDLVVLSIENSVIKLLSKEKHIILIPIEEVVGVKSDSIISTNFTDKFNPNDFCCDKCKELSRYFSSRIGRSVILRTKGDGVFKYTGKMKITSVGKSFVILDNTIVIAISKIILVEEIN